MLSENPYIAGNSVGGSPAFVGRADILQDVRQVLRHRQENAIVLYGQRRVGKTSVLKELEAELKNDGVYHPIFFDLLGKAHQSLEDVLRELADTISDALGKGKANLGNAPKTEFREVLSNVLDDLCSTESLVLLLDEFDALDDSKSQKTSQDFFRYLRDLLPINLKRLSFVFVIGRNIDDMDNIALAFFKGIRTKRVSLLDYDDTVKLIRFSVENKSLQWSNEVIEGVWQLTNGQPFLTQCLCSHVWENLYDDEPNEPPVVTLKNIEAAIPKTLESSRSALEWLWDGLPSAERIVISVLASAGAKIIAENQLEDLLHKSGVRVLIQELQDAPRLLQDWDLIEQVEGGYRFRVELLRQWIAKYKPLRRVQQEELDNIEPVANDFYNAGLGLYCRNKLDEALTPLWQAVGLNPNHVGANQLLAEILIAQGQIREACKLLENVYKHQPTVARPRLIQALLILAQSNDSKSERLKLYKRLLEIGDESSEVKKGVQDIRTFLLKKLESTDADYDQKDLENLSQLLQKTEEVEQALRYRNLLKKVDHFAKEKNYQAALKLLNQLKEEFPGEEFPGAREELISKEKQLKQEIDFEQLYQRALKALENTLQYDKQTSEKFFTQVINYLEPYSEKTILDLPQAEKKHVTVSSQNQKQLQISLRTVVVVSLISILVTFAGTISYYEGYQVDHQVIQTKNNRTYYDVVNVEVDDKLNIREEAGYDYQIIKKIPANGKCVAYLNESKFFGSSQDKKKWFHVQYQGKRGWVNSYFLKEHQHCH
jgi:tetratricopeptide (TPR) repeat protein